MLQPHLICNAATLAKKRVIVVSQKKAVAISVKDLSGRKRCWKLGEWSMAY
jgi:exodeoxyribonuclease V alpha subunit